MPCKRRGDEDHRRLPQEIQDYQQEQLDARDIAFIHIQEPRRRLPDSLWRA